MSNNRKDDLEKYARMFGALSNPHRLKIFLNLIDCCGGGCSADNKERESACVGDLGAELNISPSTISHHLKELRDSGLIKMTRQGQRVECSVAPEVIENLMRFFTLTPAFNQKQAKKTRKK